MKNPQNSAQEKSKTYTFEQKLIQIGIFNKEGQRWKSKKGLKKEN